MNLSLYLDTNVLISLFEGEGETHDALWALITESAVKGGVDFHTSALSFAELLAKPYRERDHHLAQQYLTLASTNGWLNVWDVDARVIEMSAVVRATLRMKLPDAIHLATAALSGCNRLLTADAGFMEYDDLRHPISGKTLPLSIIVTRPDPTSLAELQQALS